MVERVVREEGVNALITETSVESAEQALQIKFPGSPTVWVQGKDIDTTSRLKSHFVMG
jgi:hypothetical protein